MARIFLSCGDPSAVDIGVHLMRALRSRRDDLSFVGIGGQGMVDEGMRMIYDPSATSAMWFFGNVARVPAHARAIFESEREWVGNRPDLIITIDYQGFHLHLGTRARAMGIPVLHFVGSQFWARRYYNLEPSRRAYSHVLLIHEFEKPYYDKAKIPATYVGHPVVERLQRRVLDEAMVARLQTGAGPRVALLPGSRRIEIRNSLPIMLDAVRRLDSRPHLLVSAGHPEMRAMMEAMLAGSGASYELFDRSGAEILSAADVALVTSGSVTMECVYYGCPSAVVYRVSPISYFIGKPHIASFIAQPNVIAGREILPEFLQTRRSGARLGASLRHLLADEDARAEQRREFAAIRKRLLAGPQPSEAAADVALSMIGNSGT